MTYMRKLSSLNQLFNNLGVKSQRTLYNTIKTQSRLLDSLGQDCVNYDTKLIPVLLTKLPSELNSQISRKCEKDIRDVREVLDLINLQTETREKLWCMRKKMKVIRCSQLWLYCQYQIRVVLKVVYYAIKKIINVISVKQFQNRKFKKVSFYPKTLAAFA